ncbi:MAG: peptidylprolyl isomerase [Spirochaetes bacterium]|nr:peptidylprolyl isomerase [Spirochaetota bacterium]
MAINKKKDSPVKRMLATIIIAFVAVAFVGSFAFNYASKRGGPGALAVVNGESIPVSGDSLFANLYRQYYEEARQSSPEGVSEETNQQLLRRALDTVIQRTLILQQAKKEGITVSRDIVLASIVQRGYYASKNGSFDESRYNRTPESDRQRIFNNEKEQLVIGMFVEELFNTVQVSEPEIKSFFRLMDFGKKIEYVLVRYDDVDEDSLRRFYDENGTLFERTHAAHILIKDDEEKAEETLARVRENPDRFGEIAAEFSEDASAEKQGDLGWFYRGDMVPEFSKAAFELQAGEISGIVHTLFGYHIIKSLDSPVLQPYEEALYRVKSEYVKANKEEVEKAVGIRSKEILTAAGGGVSFPDAVSGLRLHTETTDFITLSSPYIFDKDQSYLVYELMNNEPLIDLVFSTRTGDIGGPIRTEEGEVIFRVVEEKDFDIAQYEMRKDAVARYYEEIKANNFFNDWYRHALMNSKVVDNFNKFFSREPS